MPEELDIHTDRKVYSIPEGLNELMYDISKEVLRCQPKNLYQFISDYLITLLKVREAVKVAVPIIEKEFQSAESQTNFLKKYNLSKEQGDRFATIIQAAFRGYRIRKKLLHVADDLIKAEETFQYDGRSISEEGFFTDPIFNFLKTRGVSVKQSVEAATKIQAFYRGYKVRKLEKDKGVECLIYGVPSHESWRHDWLNQAISRKDSTDEIFPWRKSFADFHKNYTRRREGDRLHIETIFGGNYEDYNQVCDLTSCQEFVIPTISEAKELATPGEIESLLSEELDLPGAQIMQEMVISKIKETPVSYEQAEKEEMLYKRLSERKKSVVGKEEKVEHEPGEYLPPRESRGSKPLISRESKKSDVASVKSEGSKRKGSKKSGSVKSQPSAQSGSAFAPELSVRSLSVEGEEEERSKITEGDVSDVSEVSAVAEEERSQGSKKSSVKSEKVSAMTVEEKAERGSKGSKKSGGSGSHKSGSKKSIVEAEPEQE